MRKGVSMMTRRKSQRTLLIAIGFASVAGSPAWAQEAEKETDSFLGKIESVFDNDDYKISVDMRQRVEIAKQNGLNRSEGMTLRTRLGIGTKPIAGFSGFAELGNIVSYCKSCYFDDD